MGVITGIVILAFIAFVLSRVLKRKTHRIQHATVETIYSQEKGIVLYGFGTQPPLKNNRRARRERNPNPVISFNYQKLGWIKDAKKLAIIDFPFFDCFLAPSCGFRKLPQTPEIRQIIKKFICFGRIYQ